MALCYTFSSMSMSLSYWGVQNGAKHSRCGFTSLSRGWITSLNLLVMVCCWLAAQAIVCHFSQEGTLLPHVHLGVHWDPRSLSQHSFLAGLLPEYNNGWSYSFPGAALWTCPCWTLWGLPHKTRCYLIIIFAIQTQITLKYIYYI